MTGENGNLSERESKKNWENTHEQLSKEEHQACRVNEDFIRLSVEIEDSKDLIFDIDQALSEV